MCRAFGGRIVTSLLLSGCLHAAWANARSIDLPTLIPSGFSNSVVWKAYEKGFMLDEQIKRGSKGSAFCENTSTSDIRGAMTVLSLDQTIAAPIVVSGWSKADGVQGSPDSDYSIYLDIAYSDGTSLWGRISSFSVGTHDWQKRQVTVIPTKPIKQVSIYALFRRHVGKVWFDSFEAHAYPAGKFFDGQLISPPVLEGKQSYGWFVRDVQAGSECIPISHTSDVKYLGLSPKAVNPTTLAISSLKNTNRAITVYYVTSFEAQGGIWWDDIRTSRPIRGNNECANLTGVDNQGAIGMISLYPFACVTSKTQGLMMGVPPSQGPVISRLGYHAGSKLLYVAFDLALVPGTEHNSASVSIVTKPFKPEWGFRQAASEYYQLFPEAFRRRTTADGLWMPFTDPSKIEGMADFGIAFHESDNSVESDKRLGILSFRYTEPMSWWMPMPTDMPRTYEKALELAKSYLTRTNAELKQWAQALMNSGTHDSNGLYNVQFQNAPWTNGAVWILNPNPFLPHPVNEATKATMSYTKERGDRTYKGAQSGEYLDSIEGWADYLDYRPESIKASPHAPTFAQDSFRSVVPTWFSVYELTKMMSDDLHQWGRLLMANSTPWRFNVFLPLLDVSGTETNWNPKSGWRPDSDAIFNYRRTLCYHKPYLLLQNTDFATFGLDDLERYLQRSMFYGVFPSMFSANAATKVYWEDPKLYNAGRPLFKRYVPIIKRLSKAGWEPITYAHTDNPKVYVERFGHEYLTVFNDSSEVVHCVISLSLNSFLGQSVQMAAVRNVLTGAKLREINGTSGQILIDLKPEQCVVLSITP